MNPSIYRTPQKITRDEIGYSQQYFSSIKPSKQSSAVKLNPYGYDPLSDYIGLQKYSGPGCNLKSTF